MADTQTKFEFLDESGVRSTSKEIFTIVKRDFATKETVNTLSDTITEMKNLYNLNPEIIDGNLYISVPEGESNPALSINSNGELILDDSGSATDANIAKLTFEISADGNLYAENAQI